MSGLLSLLLACSLPQDQPRPTFERDVLPLLQRQGCASAYCHGSATGRGGFKLSLFGSDPDADWRALAVDLDGRRVDLALPARSLLLRKPARELPHGGGLRLPDDEPAHARLRDWIAAGARRDAGLGAPRTLTAELVGARLRVRAQFDELTRRDVTDLCLFSSSDERVATIDGEGQVARHGPGEAFLIARYAGADAVVRIVLSFGEAAPDPGAAATRPADAAWRGYLAELGVRPAARAGSDRLVRRLHLDLAGRPPTPHERAAFVAAPGPQAIATAVAQLLDGREFVDVFAAVLASWFELPLPVGLPPGPAARASNVRQRLHDAVARNEPLDDLAVALLRPDEPLLAGIDDPRDRAEYIGRTFLGIGIGCARCHDHPNDRWRRADHLGFAALVATRAGTDGVVRGHVYGDDGRPAVPAMLGQPPVADDPADLLAPLRTAALGSGVFARNLCNRLLGLLLGQAPVEPVDDHRASNPPVGEPLLAALTAEYRRTRGDLRALVLWIVTSDVYALDSDPGALAPAAAELRARHYASCRSRLLASDQLAAAAAFVFGAGQPPSLPPSPLARELALQDDGFLAAAAAAPGNPVDAVADFSPDAATALGELFVLVLSRPPRADEVALLLPELRPQSLRADLRRLATILCSTREFACRR